MAAGLDAVRRLDSDQFAALGRRMRHYGVVQFLGSTGSPSRHHHPRDPLCRLTAAFPYALCSGRGRRRRGTAVRPAFREQGPGDACGLAGQRHCGQPRQAPFQQGLGPRAGRCRREASAHMSDHGGGAENQQPAQVGVALLGDAALALLAPAAVLLGHQPDPGGEVPSRAELGGIAHAGHDGAGGDRADAGDGGQPPSGRAALVPGQDGGLGRFEALLQRAITYLTQ